jgi:hypothetical protein
LVALRVLLGRDGKSFYSVEIYARAAILRLDVGGNLPVRFQQKSIWTEERKTNSAKIEIHWSFLFFLNINVVLFWRFFPFPKWLCINPNPKAVCEREGSFLRIACLLGKQKPIPEDAPF